MKNILMLVALILISGCGAIVQAQDHREPLPFQPGERLVFEVRWEFIRAGEAVLEILPVEDFDGEPCFHFVMTARTTPFIDVFYKVRDRYDAYTDAGMSHALLYTKKKSGRRKKEIRVPFDWDKKESQYVAVGEEWKPISLLANSFDPLSVFYAFRLNNLKVGKALHAAVSDGKKCVMGMAKVLKRERIQVKGADYDTFLVEPDLKDVGGVFEKSKDAKVKIWVTADYRRIPVRFESEVVVGSFVAELVSAEGLKRK